MVRICYIRSFGHFVARLQGSILQFNPEVGIFVSIAQSEQESLLQQAQAQFRMVSQPSLPGNASHWASRRSSKGLGCTGSSYLKNQGASSEAQRGLRVELLGRA